MVHFYCYVVKIFAVFFENENKKLNDKPMVLYFGV